MIPRRLEVRDFLSYEQPEPLDFTLFDVACLSGDNGAGKSALLDAMTFALFGAARGCEGGRNTERLIRDGADEAVVDFSFGLGESTYRIVRRRDRRSGRLQLLEERPDGWTDIGGDSLRETDHKIAAILRMDYRTFTASAFFLQGRADDFLRMTAEQRREVFGKLLDLDVYEKLEEVARERARDTERRREAHGRRTAELAEAPAVVESLQSQMAQAQRRAQQADADATTASAASDDLRKQVAELAADEVGLERDRKTLLELERRLAEARSTAAAKHAALEELDALLARTDEIRAAIAEVEILRVEEQELRARRERDAELNRLEAQAVAGIAAERDALERAIADTAKAVATTEKEIATLASDQRELARVEADLEGVEGAHIALEAAQAKLAAAQANGARLEERVSIIGTRTEEISESMRILDRGGGECPVCGSTLDNAHRRKVAQGFVRESKKLGFERDSSTSDLEVARKDAAVASEEIHRLGAVLAERDELRGRRESLRSRLERLPFLEQQAARLRAAQQADTESLAAERYALDIRTTVDAIRTERAARYDAAAHEALRQRIEQLQRAERELGRIEQASVQRDALEDELERAQRAEVTAAGELETLGTEIARLIQRVSGLGPARKRLEHADRNIAELLQTTSHLSAQAAALGERLEGAQRDAAALEVSREAEKQAAVTKRHYARLTEAFGRRGIPDRIIDNARPALQSEADEILGRLTGHTMSVRFEMQRETKSGKARDAFDVMVRHDGGDRDFAMFSGGEAFRIAFAVRLALSKLLVDRAGASLQTLVVDEGFGTQDPQGRDRLVEALRMARADLGFAKVLVITHLEDIKDLFGAQIRVTKDPARGSVVEIVRT